LQESVAGQQDLAHILASDDPVLGLVPINDQLPVTFVADRVFVHFQRATLNRNIGGLIIPDFPTGTRQAMFWGMHALAGALLGVKSNEQIRLEVTLAVSSDQIAGRFEFF
jgi:hypothetical protein